MNQDNKLDFDITLMSMEQYNLILHDWKKTDWFNCIVNDNYE